MKWLRVHAELVTLGGTRVVMWLVFLLVAGIQGFVETEEFISDLDKPGELINLLLTFIRPSLIRFRSFSVYRLLFLLMNALFVNYFFKEN